jgi:hypothetical protein
MELNLRTFDIGDIFLVIQYKRELIQMKGGKSHDCDYDF